ncbi:alcohol dehydrogenase [Tersicoccus phoenicis]|uniref:Alcohol dehydrogenase n=1 Tax=Tersicoccus phoenicis TaxID=554083 RepID=A0A1R1LJK1_9MICC|nr:NAD(P)-dependent alcohol dehydrogenase [Tersicoccus phoenicis]OMH27711.1 alcohol dehydrogenase [Tersicoccus phoenicis]
MKVTAAVVRETGAPLTIEELDLGEPRPDEVRVRMVASGICHTDATARGGAYPIEWPAVLGHEGAGIVEEIGSAVKSVAVGDHVVMAPASCGRCTSCRRGEAAYCVHYIELNLSGRHGSLSSGDEAVSSHFFGQSSFSSHANVLERCVVKVDPDVPLEMVAPLGCGLQTGAGAVLNDCRPEAASSLAVIGTGAVGSAAIMAARIAGCTTVIAVDLHDSRLETASELGATHTVNSGTTDMVEELDRITDGDGVDYIVDTTSAPPVLNQAARALAVRGKLVAVGNTTFGTEAPFEIGESQVKGWTFTMSVQGSSVYQLFIPKLIELWKQGRFPYDKLIKTYPFEDINQAFEDSAKGSTIKPIVVF